MCSPASCRPDEHRLLLGGELGLLAPQPALGAGDLHPFARAHPDQVGLELGDHRQHVEQQPADRVARIMNRAADAQAHLPARQLLDDVASVGHRARQTIELGHHQRVAGPARRQRLTQPRPITPSTGQPMIDIDPSRRDAERRERVALRGQVLRVGRDARVTNQDPAHARSVPHRAPSPGTFGRVLRDTPWPAHAGSRRDGSLSRWGNHKRDTRQPTSHPNPHRRHERESRGPRG